MGVTQAAGLSLRWLRDEVCSGEIQEAREQGVDPYDIMTKEAQSVRVGADKLLYLPYLMGERTPHLDPDCRGVFFGLSGMHTRAHMIRAVMEGVGYSLQDCAEILKEMKIELSDMMACGGGGRSPLWRQMLADLYRCPVKTVDTKEGPALGVAILAGVGAGIYRSVEEGCDALIHTDRIQQPSEENAKQYDTYYQLYRELYQDLKERFKELASLT